MKPNRSGGPKRSAVAAVAAPERISSRLNLFIWLSALWAVFIVWKYFHTHGYPLAILGSLGINFAPPTPEVLARHGIAFAIWAASAWGLACAGHFLLSLFFREEFMGTEISADAAIRPLSALSQFVLSAALGLALCSYGIFLLGVAQLYRAFVFWGLWAALLILGLSYGSMRLAPLAMAALKQIGRIWAQISIFIRVPLALLALLSLMMAFVPDIFYDSMVYHFGVPNMYLHDGGIKNYPHVLSKFPMFMQMIYLFGLALKGHAVAKLFHWFCAALIALAAFAWADEEGEPSAGAWAALGFLSMPMAMMNGWTGGVDVGLSLFALLSIWCWVRALSRPSKHWLLAAGVLAGIVFAAKYTAAFVPVFLLLIHGARRVIWDKNPRAALQESVWLVLGMAISAGPWLIKNWAHTGNPFFPFFNFLFNSEYYDAVRFERMQGESPGWTPNSFIQWATLPWRLTFQELSSLSFPGPWPLAFLPLGLGVVSADKSSPRMRWAMAAGLAALFAMLYISRLTRYSLPYLVVVLMAMGWGLARTLRFQPKFFAHGLALLALIVGFGNGLQGLAIMRNAYLPWDVLFGRETSVEYLSYTHSGMNPYPATKAFQAVKEIMPKSGRLLILGDEKVSTCPVPFDVAGVFDVPLLTRWAKGISSAQELYRIVRQEKGVTHILVNAKEGVRIGGYGIFDVEPDVLALWCDFWRQHIRLVKVEPIPEKFLNDNPPVFIFEIVEQLPAGQEPAFNPVLLLYEEYKAPSREAGAMEKKIELMRSLAQRFPQIPAFARRLSELRASGR
ncbi:MAG: glycosyltransferase family 39 protein [Elusimicrobia bacterium]|nr:glycosyltransferase family 39 protein [Elusimicrobiota bacterium]